MEYCKDELENKTMTNFKWFKFNSKFMNNTDNAGTAYVKITVPLKYSRNHWKKLAIGGINCEIKLMVIWWGNHLRNI